MDRHAAVASSAKQTRTRPTPPPPSTPLVHLSFTRDASCFIAADASAVHWRSCDTFALRGLYQERDAGRTVVAAAGDMRHEKASICAVTSRVAPGPGRAAAAASEPALFAVRRWQPGYINYHWRYNDWEAAVAEVRAVHVHGDMTVLVLDGRVDVYGAGVLHRVDTGRGNPLGLCAVSQGGVDAPFVFACPGAGVGEAHVERWAGEFKPLSIPAHSSALACMAMSRDGRLLATASVKGTILRVFCAAAGVLLRELRRGSDRADIHCLAFSPDSKWLAASSDKGTIHVFNVNVDLTSSPEHGDDGDAPNATTKVNQGWSLSYFSGFVPVPRYFRQDYSLAKLHLREGVKYMVAFSHEPHTVLIIGMDGSFAKCFDEKIAYCLAIYLPEEGLAPKTLATVPHPPPPPRTKPFAPKLRSRRRRHEAARREGDHYGLREALQVHGPQPEAPPGEARRGGPRPGARPLLPPPPQEPRLLRLRGARPPRHRRRPPAPRRRGDPHRQVHPPRRLPPHRPRARPPRGARAPPRLAQARHRALLPLRQLRAQVVPSAHHREHQVRRRRRRHVHVRCAARVRHRGQVGAGLQEGRYQRRGCAAPGGRRGVSPQGGRAHVR